MALMTAVAFVVTVALTPVAAAAAVRLGIVDRPGPFKLQTRPVPYLGGVAVLVGLMGPLLATHATLAIPVGLAAAVGLGDDKVGLPVSVRLACEGGIAVVVPIVVGVPWEAAPVAAATVLVMINAVNLLDGLDGLATATALVSGVGFAVVLHGDFRVAATALAGSLAGFLVWNRPPARIYLGDAGSYMLGTMLAVLAAATLRPGESVHGRAAALLLVGVPVGDTAVAVVRRWRAKRPLFVGDRGHVYDQLSARNWSTLQATAACVCAQLVLAAVAVAVLHAPASGAIGITAGTIAVVGIWAVHTFTSPASWSD